MGILVVTRAKYLLITLKIASGDVYDESYGNIESKTFNIQHILPRNFELRDPSCKPNLSVSSLPEHLHDQLIASKNDNSKAKDDLSLLLSQNHLQYLFSQFLGVRQRKSSSSTGVSQRKSSGSTGVVNILSKHPLWDRITNLIRESSVPIPDLPLDGLAYTVNEHIRQLSTAIANMWEGSIYKKSLDYLLRILLRIHLAPKREQRYQERIKSRRSNRTCATKQTPRKRKRSVIALCDQLCEALQHQDPAEHRVNVVIQRLLKLNLFKPEPSPNLSKGLKLEQQLQSLNSTYEDDESDYSDDGTDIDANDLYDDDTIEPSRSRLKSLQAILTTLLESPNVNEKIDNNWVRKTAYPGSNLTTRECKVITKLVTLLRPYIPKRCPDSDGTYHEATPHVTLRAPLVLIANTILRATGYHRFTRDVSPQISPSTPQSLILGAKGMFEVFCGKSDNQYSIVGLSGSPLINGNDVSRNKQAIFGSFFNMEKLQSLCRSHGLVFADR
jgi:hypothetical protein